MAYGYFFAFRQIHNFAKTVTSYYGRKEAKSGKPVQTIYCNDPSKNNTSLNIIIYGYSSDFISDIILIASEFNWKVNQEELAKETKTEVISGLILHKENEWELARYGKIDCTYDFGKTQNQEIVMQFFARVTKQIIERLTT